MKGDFATKEDRAERNLLRAIILIGGLIISRPARKSKTNFISLHNQLSSRAFFFLSFTC